jgi:hypothetical protein
LRLVPITSIALACALGATAARADNVTFTDFAHGSETVTFSLVAPNAVASGTVSAGGFATTLNNGPSFVSYCVDLYQHIAFGTPYPEYTAPGTTHVFANSSRAYADLGRLYANAGVVDTSVEEAAFQIAVWEIAYETTPGAYSLDSGAASFSGGSAAGGALGLASTWLAGLGNGAGRSVSVIESSDHQDVIFAPVPEPSTYMLMFAGLLATVEISRRKRKQA